MLKINRIKIMSTRKIKTNLRRGVAAVRKMPMECAKVASEEARTTTKVETSNASTATRLTCPTLLSTLT